MMKLDPLGGWAWSPGQWEYEMMIQGVYMTLGVMMIIASKEPVKHYMFVWFVVWTALSMVELWLIKQLLMSMKWGIFWEIYPHYLFWQY